MGDDKPASITWRVVATRRSYECNRDHGAELLKRLLEGSPLSAEGGKVSKELRLKMDDDTLKVIDERGRTRLRFSEREWSPISFDVAREHLVDAKPCVSHLEFDELNWKWRIRSRFCDAHPNDETIEDVLADEAYWWITSVDREALVPAELNFHVDLGVPCTVQISCGELCEFDPRDDWEFFGSAQNTLDEKEYLFAGEDGVMVVTDVRAGDFPTARELTMSEALGLSGLQDEGNRSCSHPEEPLSLISIDEETGSPTADDGKAGALSEKAQVQLPDSEPQDSESASNSSNDEPNHAVADIEHREPVPSDLVRLSEAAGMVQREKRTLERWQQKDDTFPLPVIQGGGGKPSFWSWAEIRPCLERHANRSLPERFPSHGEK
ncbi:hypothetical protein [Candidatus Laterigemmans baculatus]|uniref:hypothetical protein n=1 Tax=Candidatus Laterigemmans baculatus TaxID=2770505 RepID=UPI0013DC2690|nr:hypothetical protein [Candidatus Laterigemmans baculatus]